MNEYSKDIKIKNIELLESSLTTFKKSFKDFVDFTVDFYGRGKDFADKEKVETFNNLILSYYEIVINLNKNLISFNKGYIKSLIETYIELWLNAPKLKEKNYFTPFLFDLCKFLFQIKEYEKLSFFYNLMIFSKEIPFLPYSSGIKDYLSEMHENEDGEDIFKEMKEAGSNINLKSFDNNLFEYEYSRFFQIISSWEEMSSGYHSKDEISFMTGLFILDELIERFYIQNDDDKLSELNSYYEKTLKYFKKAMNQNPNNPRYFYEYARCLKNSGKSAEAEIFFKKAFDLTKNT